MQVEYARKVLERLRDVMNEKKDFLVELDARMGDGDLGLTMQKAFSRAAEDALGDELIQMKDAGKFLMKSGMSMAKAAPSTMGTLVATGFMRGGKAIAEGGDSSPEEVSTAELAAFFSSFVYGIMERGKAKPGDKTIIDALQPAAETLKQESEKRTPVREALTRAVEAAEAGLEATKEMIAQFGRLAYFREQSIGFADPGATVGVFLVKGFLEVLA